jgi:hypothetical protein
MSDPELGLSGIKYMQLVFRRRGQGEKVHVSRQYWKGVKGRLIWVDIPGEEAP